ncbi:MAG TPA: prolyl oligopeptidase family serine peptidase [Planctomycetota bacterium]|nr:prolyl oligopeptidase family serine peptidase [Planctomycetota bacterium]
MPELIDFVVWSQNRDVIGCACTPDEITRDTGFMLVVHGHGNSRFQYRDMMLDFAPRFNVICVSPEYRDSGRDSGQGERGTRDPYDWSHLQVVDTMNCLRRVKLDFPDCDRSRTIAWGGSQGAHIVMLASAFAPRTFALTIECCGIADVTGKLPMRREWIRETHAAEIRSPVRWIDRIRNKVHVFHGTADETVDVEHGYAFEKALKEHGKEFEAHYTEGGRHFLDPVTGRDKETVKHCTEDIMARKLTGPDDFELESSYRFDCTGATYVVSFAGGWMTLRMEGKEDPS